MATRYWVGGSGTWDSVSTTNWSTISGGLGGASVPTYADNVIFDTLSNATLYTVTMAGGFFGNGTITAGVLNITSVVSGSLTVGSTISTVASYAVDATSYVAGGTYITSFGTGTGGIGTYNLNISQTTVAITLAAVPSCADISVSGPATGAVTFAGATSADLEIYGSATLPATGLTWTAQGAVIFCSTTTGNTITTNGVSITAGTTKGLVFDGVGGGWTFGSALTVVSSQGIRVNRGSISTGNFSVTSPLLQSTGTYTRSISLGSSSVTLSGTSPLNFTSTGLTFTAGTSTITLSASVGSTTVVSFIGGSQTFYNVTYSSNAPFIKTIQGANSFNNLTFALRGNATTDTVIFYENQTITGAISLGLSTAIDRRRYFRSDVFGTQRTLTVQSSASFNNADFQDIVIAGAASPISGSALGNAGNNSGITFSASKTVYWSLVAGGAWNATAWATTSGGAPSVNNFPLAQDTAIIQDTGLNSAATITAALFVVGTLNFSTRTLPMNFTINSGTAIFAGPLYLSSAVTINGTLGSRTGTSSGTLDITGVSSGPGNLISASAAGTLTITGTSSGPGNLISASAAGTLTITGTSSGTVTITAGADGTMIITGSSTGLVKVVASASGILEILGSAAGGLIVKATASGSMTITGSAHGGFPPRMYYGTEYINGAYINNKVVSRIYIGNTMILST